MWRVSDRVKGVEETGDVAGCNGVVEGGGTGSGGYEKGGMGCGINLGC